MECTRLAPSAVNYQPWYFQIVTHPEMLIKLHSCYDRDWFRTAPCVIVASVNHQQSWHRKSDGKDHADIDISIAIEHLCLAATEQGLGTCWVCNFNVDDVRDLLKCNDNIEPIALISLGYPLGEIPQKKRKSLEEISEHI